MLRQLFGRGNKLAHKDAQVRLQAIAGLQAPTDEERYQLSKLAVEDESEEVRLAAIGLVEDEAVLIRLIEDEALADVVTQRLATNALQNKQGNALKDERILAAAVKRAQPQDVAFLVPFLHSAVQIAELAIRMPQSEQAQLLDHPSLACEAGWIALERASRGRDKRCNRHARTHLDRLKNARADCGTALQEITAVDHSIHRALQSKPTHRRELIAQRQKLNALNQSRLRALAKWQEQHEIQNQLGGVSDQPAADLLPATNPLEGLDLSIPELGDDPFIPLVNQLESLSQQLRDNPNFDAPTPTGSTDETTAPLQRREEITSAWLTLADKIAPEPEQHAVFERVSKQFKIAEAAWRRFTQLNLADLVAPDVLDESNLDAPARRVAIEIRQIFLKQWRKGLSSVKWPTDHAMPPELLQLSADLTRVDSEVGRLQGSQASIEAKIAELLKRIELSLDDGQVKSAPLATIYASRASYTSNYRPLVIAMATTNIRQTH